VIDFPRQPARGTDNYLRVTAEPELDGERIIKRELGLFFFDSRDSHATERALAYAVKVGKDTLHPYTVSAWKPNGIFPRHVKVIGY